MVKQAIYCVKCRSKTPSVSPHAVKSKNGRSMVKAKCAKCGTTKCMFVKGGSLFESGSGFFSDLF